MLIRLRRGVQLLELLLSLVTASVLLTGLGSAFLIANGGTQLSLQRQSASSLTQAGMLRLQSDLAEAFLVKCGTRIMLTLPMACTSSTDFSSEFVLRIACGDFQLGLLPGPARQLA